MPAEAALFALPALCGPRLLHPDPATMLRLLLLAPLLEEWIVRAGLQEWLMRRHPGRGVAPAALAVLAPAAGFSLLHIAAGWSAAAAVFAPGVALGLVYLRWRDWRLCAAAHALFNGCALAFCGSNFL
ncbi:JDVT-CTERM system glutamic-type intramembrane protease MrtJ [Pseudoduganella namucuonensis]|uniref:CAAX protease self-immunity n=1 Tax=Pseudoduganella namucuonensis TaxID=1035707 RepID=A0A1I7KT92_9BURK|nr:JDVT-CTERM system glutamic-type intramembrane protease [Pseudoduganella namucuonensis]SFV00673.1 CAAX protease self-immunity [Pseudoduganella namucuonensis]